MLVSCWCEKQNGPPRSCPFMGKSVAGLLCSCEGFWTCAIPRVAGELAGNCQARRQRRSRRGGGALLGLLFIPSLQKENAGKRLPHLGNTPDRLGVGEIKLSVCSGSRLAGPAVSQALHSPLFCPQLLFFRMNLLRFNRVALAPKRISRGDTREGSPRLPAAGLPQNARAIKSQAVFSLTT